MANYGTLAMLLSLQAVLESDNPEKANQKAKEILEAVVEEMRK